MDGRLLERLGCLSRHRWARIVAVCLAASLLVTLLEMPHLGRRAFLSALAFNLIISYCIGALAGFVFPSLVPFFNRQAPLLNWALRVLTLLAVGLIGSGVATVVANVIGVMPPAPLATILRNVSQVAVVITITFGVGMTLYERLRARLEETTLELRTKELEKERALKLAAQAQLASLESRLHPHFLFNTLNSISALIQDDPHRAERMVERLATLLRFSLDATHRSTVPLGEELRIVTDYLEIEKARYGDRLQYVIDVADDLNAVEVPSLSLQTLVENSVKHAVARRRSGGEIRVEGRAERGTVVLTVSDDGPGFTVAEIVTGHGLDNLRGRLAALFGSKAGLEVSRDGRSVVAISLPRHDRQPTAAR